MEKLGFGRKWTNWVMECIRTVKYFVRLSGHQTGLLPPSWASTGGPLVTLHFFCLVANDLYNQQENNRTVSKRISYLQACTWNLPPLVR
jgi:hypothetical protein